MPGYTLKVKTKRGQQLLDGLDADSTVGELKKRLNELTEIPETNLHILTGFPPKKLDISILESTIKAVGVVNGDTLIVEEKAATSTSGNPNAAVRDQEAADQELAQSLAAAENSEFNGILMKKVVPADNSCLFTSIGKWGPLRLELTTIRKDTYTHFLSLSGYVLNGTVDTDIGAFMRQIIAQHVANDKATYTEAMLGRPNLEYCEWILRLDSWGGAIEVSILSSFYGMEICVVDIINAIIIRFGEDQNYGTRAFLLFDGIHYDPLYMESITVSGRRIWFLLSSHFIYCLLSGWCTEDNIPAGGHQHVPAGGAIGQGGKRFAPVYGCQQVYSSLHGLRLVADWAGGGTAARQIDGPCELWGGVRESKAPLTCCVLE